MASTLNSASHQQREQREEKREETRAAHSKTYSSCSTTTTTTTMTSSTIATSPIMGPAQGTPPRRQSILKAESAGLSPDAFCSTAVSTPLTNNSVPEVIRSQQRWLDRNIDEAEGVPSGSTERQRLEVALVAARDRVRELEADLAAVVQRISPKTKWSEPLVRSVVAVEQESDLSDAEAAAETERDDVGAVGAAIASDARANEAEADDELLLPLGPPPKPPPRSPRSLLQSESDEEITPPDHGQKQRPRSLKTALLRKETWTQLEDSAMQPVSAMAEKSAAASLNAILAKGEATPADDSLEAFAFVDQVHPLTLLASSIFYLCSTLCLPAHHHSCPCTSALCRRPCREIRRASE